MILCQVHMFLNRPERPILIKYLLLSCDRIFDNMRDNRLLLIENRKIVRPGASFIAHRKNTHSMQITWNGSRVFLSRLSKSIKKKETRRSGNSLLTMTGSMHHDHPAMPQRISCRRMSTGYLRSCQVDRNRGWQAVGHRWCSTKLPFFIAAGDSSDVPGWYRTC